jgi:CheY-like chemotaxis protein
MISCVVLNALKFTEEGKISVTAKLSSKSRYIIINVKDTGSGIPAAFLPNLFKAFSREDDSLTRQSEGLGLGLLVAKGLSRKIGGELFCVRSETSGPNKGSDFEMHVPLTPGDVCSRIGTPHSSPTPTRHSRHSHSADMDRTSTERGRSRNTPTPLNDQAKDLLRDHRVPYPTPAQLSGSTPLAVPSPLPTSSPARRYSTPNRRLHKTKSDIDRNLARRHPLNFLVAEDNKINRKLLVSMLRKLGYNKVREAYDGADAVRQWSIDRENGREIDVVLMDLWMPYMDGYEATEKILSMAVDDDMDGSPQKIPTILAVTADVTDGALERAAKAGMKGFMTKPYKLIDLEKLIVEYCATQVHEDY